MAADGEDCFRSIEVFWSKDVTDAEDDNLAYVPGILAPGNRRPAKITARKMREVKAAIPRRQPKVEDLPIHSDGPPTKDKPQALNTNDNNNKENGWMDRLKKASLKDLCNEDKKRIADLIRELARVGDEKEGALKQLQQERLQFENHINDVLGQQEALLKEREGVQTQLLACQALLMRYQQLVSEQHDKESVVSAEVTAKRTEDKGVNSSFALSSPRSDGATSERKAELYTPKKHVRRASVESYTPVAKCDVQSSSHRHTNATDLPPQTDSNPLAANHLHYGVQHAAPPHSIPVAPDGRVLPRHQHNCYCPYHNLEQCVPTQSCDAYQNTTAPSTGAVQHRYDDASPGCRPFTKVIDQEIAKEKSVVARPAFAVSDERLFGIGPLAVPALSSTQRSDYGSVDGAPHGGATVGMNFNPPKPETAHPSLVLSDGTTSLPENLPEEEFIRYYQQLTPAERKRQLQSQKAALLEEQQYLRKVLSEQEHLLSSKQQQLHKQQSVQRQRLEYFEQNGHFPGLPPDGSTVGGATTDRDDETSDLVRQRLEGMWLQEHVAPSVASFRNGKSASVEAYSAGKPAPVVRRTVSVATSPIRSSELGRDERQARRRGATGRDVDNSICQERLRSSLKPASREGTKHRVAARHTPRQLSVSLPVCDASVTSLLDIVDEVESLHNATADNTTTSATKQQSKASGDVSLAAKQPNTSWSELDMSDSLEESRVLEDVFFVK